MMIRLAIFLWLVLAAWPASARELDGIRIPDSLNVSGEPGPLQLNGTGYRKKFLFNVYIGALYTLAPVRTADAALQDGATRVMRLYFVRDVARDKIANGWRDAFEANHSADQQRALVTRINDLNAMMPDVKPGDVMQMELLSAGNTRVLFNAKLLGTISGADFQQALLRLWLGSKPADADMKRALLGG